MRYTFMIMIIISIVTVSCTGNNDRQDTRLSDSATVDTTIQLERRVPVAAKDTAAVSKKRIKSFGEWADREPYWYNIGTEVVTSTLVDNYDPEEYVKYFYKPTPQDDELVKESRVPSKDTTLYYGLSIMVTIDETTTKGVVHDTVYLTRKMLQPLIDEYDIKRYQLSSFNSLGTHGDTLVFSGVLRHSSPNNYEAYAVRFNYIAKSKKIDNLTAEIAGF